MTDQIETGTKTVEEFYDALKMGNAVSNQQATDLVRLSITGKISNAIEKGEDLEKVKGLMELLKSINSE